MAKYKYTKPLRELHYVVKFYLSYFSKVIEKQLMQYVGSIY